MNDDELIEKIENIKQLIYKNKTGSAFLGCLNLIEEIRNAPK